VLPAFHEHVSYVQLAALPVKKTTDWQQILARDLGAAWAERARESQAEDRLLDGKNERDDEH
jgi:hypothetical protein